MTNCAYFIGATLLLGIFAGPVSGQAPPLPPAPAPGASMTPPAPAPDASTTLLAGNWAGTLNAGMAQLRVVFHITAAPGGGYASTMDSIDQQAMGLPVAATTLTNNAVTLSLPQINAQFAGVRSADGKTLTGLWTQGGNSLPLTLTKTNKIPDGPRRPQEPHPPFPYKTRDVTYANTAGGVTLSGTLSTPPAGGPFPAAILVTGSGAHDRDETIAGHKPFLVISDYLTRHGIAVLRVDDRGVGGSTGNKSQSNDHDFAGDVLAGVKFLKTQSDINPKKIGLIGHSEGGLIAPLAAAHAKSVAFIVLLAGPGVPGEQILLEQGILILKAMGASPALIDFSHRQQKQMLDITQSTPDNALAKTKLSALLKTALTQLPAELQPQQAQYVSNLKAQQSVMLSPWFRGFLASRPAAVLRQVQCPVLALGGSKDLQVPAAESLTAIAAALHAGHNPDVTVREMPGLNHLFQPSATGSLMEYSTIEETFSPDALQIMGDWITRRFCAP